MENFINLAKEKNPLLAAEARLRSGLTIKNVNGEDLTSDDAWETGDPATGAPPRPDMVTSRLESVAEVEASQGSIKDEEIVKIIKQSPENNPTRAGVIRGMKASTAERIARDASPTEVIQLQEIADEAQVREITGRAGRLDGRINDLQTRRADINNRINAGNIVTPGRVDDE